MNNTYRGWWAVPLNRPAYIWLNTGEYVPEGHSDPWVAITAPDGREWEVLAEVGTDGEAYVRSLVIRGEAVTPAVLRQQPLASLARVAAAVVADVEAGRESGLTLADAIEDAAVGPNHATGPTLGSKPTPEEFAAIWRREDANVVRAVGGGKYGVDTRATRERVADAYGKSPSLIDKWLREFRDANPNLIPKKTAGRPRKPTTSGNKPGGTTKKEK